MHSAMIRVFAITAVLQVAFAISVCPCAAQQVSTAEALSAKLFVADNVDTRRDAAAEIREASRDTQLASLPAMIKSLQEEKDSQVRLTVLEALQILGPQAEPATAVLLESLKEKKVEAGAEEQHQDLRIAMILSQIGSPSESGLIEILQAKREHVRAYAATALGRIHTKDAGAIARIIEMLGDKNDLVREESSLALANIGPVAADALCQAYPTADKEVQLGMLRAICKWGELPESARLLVIGALESSDPAALAIAIDAAARCGLNADQLRAAYLKNMANADAGVRFAVINSVRQQSGLAESMRADLLPLLKSSDAGVVRDTAVLLTTLGQSVLPDLLAALESDNSQIQVLGESLALLGPKITPDLIKAIAHENPRVRAGAATALGTIVPARAESIEALGNALKDSDETVQSQTLVAIERLGPRAKTAIDSTRQLLQSPSATVRLKAVDAMFHVAPRNETLANDLTPLVSDADDTVQVHVIQILQTLGPISKSAIPSVLNYLHDEPPEVRLAAAAFMASHGARAVDALPSLRLMLNDSAPELRLAAITALTQMRGSAKPVFNDLVVCLNDSTSNVKGAAINAITVIESDFSVVEPHLTAALKSDDPILCGEGLKAFGRMGKDAGILVPVVIPLAKNKELKNRVDRSLRAFRKSGPDARTIPQLIELAKAPEPNVALIAIEFLGLTQADKTDIIAALQSLESSENNDIKEAVKNSLAKLDPK